MATIVSEANLITKEECFKNTKLMIKEMQDIKDAQNDIKISITALPEKILEKCDERYADKKTEKNVDKIMWLVISAVIIAILSLILK